MYRRFSAYENQTVAGQGEWVSSNLSCQNKLLLTGHSRDTAGWDFELSTCSPSAAPSGLCWGCGDWSHFGRGEGPMQPMLAPRKLYILAVFSFNIFMTVNDKATAVIVYKLSLLDIWINYPWVEKFRLLKAFFLPSLLLERTILFGAMLEWAWKKVLSVGTYHGKEMC